MSCSMASRCARLFVLQPSPIYMYVLPMFWKSEYTRSTFVDVDSWCKKIYVGDQVLDNVGDVCCSIVQPFAVLFQLFFCAPGACDGRGAGRASWAVGLCASLHISAPAATMFKQHESSDIFDGGGSCIYVPTTIHAWTVDSSFSCKPPAACHALSEFAATLNSGTTREQDRVQVDLCVGS